MRVLVTGAAGHIGGFVLDDLLARGHQVVATDLVPVDDPRVECVHTGDLRDPQLVRKAMDGAEAVVHLGAIPHPNSDDDGALFATNCLTAHRVLDEAGRHGIGRVVAASSLSAVGLAWSPVPQSPRYVPVDEEHPTLVQDPYGLSKIVLEEIARATHRRYGTDIVCLRFPFTGTGERLTRQLEAVRSDPAAHRRDLWGWLDTRDAAESIRRSLETELRGCHVLNVAAADTSSPLATAALMAQHHPGVPAFAELAGHSSLFDTGACARLLGFAPRHGWRTGPPLLTEETPEATPQGEN
ncbi:NAD(P)-dependent oxidoreductase [Streptomyces sp. AK02-01A]|uniref:NAD-dependent epimerase/dehydratase family protein n=1 Tax=Streptomyces sp. AK02-01A TaxID=3028648 RepID=UPI0029B2389B|nr:NAD(P)-dependent oxidoreductase [Streptomyces sp. AK02-01A]MDX3853849.1 NAD(P)-dependent oxidoreductase [Streptomyces sp. AK02-01A]